MWKFSCSVTMINPYFIAPVVLQTNVKAVVSSAFQQHHSFLFNFGVRKHFSLGMLTSPRLQ